MSLSSPITWPGRFLRLRCFRVAPGSAFDKVHRRLHHMHRIGGLVELDPLGLQRLSEPVRQDVQAYLLFRRRDVYPFDVLAHDLLQPCSVTLWHAALPDAHLWG